MANLLYTVLKMVLYSMEKSFTIVMSQKNIVLGMHIRTRFGSLNLSIP